MLKMARVVGVHPESHSVDVVIMDDGRRHSGVKVLCEMAAGDFGSSGLADPTNTGFDAQNSGERDIYAAVAWMGYTPVVLGFVPPSVSQMMFPEKSRRIHRFPSDVYLSVDPDGNAELFHPSGAYVRIGTDSAHEDLSGKDYNKIWAIKRNTDKAVHIHIAQAGGAATLNIAPDGSIAIHSAATLAIDAANGTSITTPTLTLNGNLQLNGGATVTDDVVANGISLVNHDHTDPQGGKTGKPS